MRKVSRDPCLQLLCDLIAIDSVNPSLVPGARGEGEIADAIARHLTRIGLDVEVENVAPGRPNVVGVLEGRAPGLTLMLCGHMDTVGVDGMEAPFDPVEREGRIYGRGAQDMKGGLAAMIDAARLAAAGGLRRGRLLVAAVVDEEYASAGADALVSRWHADAAIVTEPTDVQIGVAHKGFAWLDVETRGRAAHGSRPREGRDAILRMGRVLQRLEALDRELQLRIPHARLGTPSLHASLIEGGQELSSYPARCGLRMERRTLPGESGSEAVREVFEILEILAAEDPDFRSEVHLRFARPPYEIDPAHPLPRELSTILSSMGYEAETVGVSFWTDAAVLGAAGIPSVLFGPGGGGLHGCEEYTRAEEVLLCRDALAQLTQAPMLTGV
jgi:acetylornithine deacetylase